MADSDADDCLGPARLGALVEGQLSPPDRQAALAHLGTCHVCRDGMAQMCAEEALQRDDELLPTAPGVCIGSRYTLCEPVGEGGWGEVWSALDERLRRKVAIKLLRSERAINPDDHYRIVREAETLARLRHPSIVAVYDSGDFDGRPYLVMDLIEGVPLPVYLAQSKPSAAAIFALFRQAGSGLAMAHRAAIVHRDFKPANLLIDGAGQLHITDFGLATRVLTTTQSQATLDDAPDAPVSLLDLRLTPTQGCLGTPAYLAPELLQGEMATPQSDQFAFCVSLVEALTGSQLMTASDVRGGGIARTELTSRLRQVPSRLRPVLARGLDPDASRRYPDLDALLGDVRVRDRRRWVRRIAAATAGVTSLLVVGSLIVRQARITQCVPEATPFTTTAKATTLPTAEGSGARSFVRAALQEYQDERLAAYSDVCRATTGRPLEGSAVLRAQFFCLEDARVAEEVVARVVSNDDDVLPGLYLLGRLQAIRECGELSEARVSGYGRSAEAGTQRQLQFAELLAREHLEDTRDELLALLDTVDPTSAFAADLLVALGVQTANRDTEQARAVDYFERALAVAMASTNRRATLIALFSLLKFDDGDRPRSDLLLELAEPLANAQGRRPYFLSQRAAHHVRRGEFDQALADIDLALRARESTTLLDELRARRLMVRSLQTRAKIEQYRGEHAAALHSARAAAETHLSLSGTDAAYAVVLAQLGGYAERADQFEESLDAFDQAAELFATRDKPALEMRSRVQQARQLSSLMRWEQAIAVLEQTEARAESLGMHVSVAEATTFLAYIHEVRGEWEQRKAVCARNESASVAGYGPTHVRTLEHAAFCLDGRRAGPQQREALQSLVATLQANHDGLSQRAKRTSRTALVRAHCELARAALHAGDFVVAEAQARAARKRAHEVPDNDSRTAEILLADALVRQGRHEQGWAILEAALRGARSDLDRRRDNAVDLAGHLALASGVLAMIPGQQDAARGLKQEARERLTAADLPVRVADL